MISLQNVYKKIKDDNVLNDFTYTFEGGQNLPYPWS